MASVSLSSSGVLWAGSRQWTRRAVRAKAERDPKASEGPVSYGRDWFDQTREGAQPRFKSVREEIAYKREANRIANNGQERKDLYTDSWDGYVYKKKGFNILQLLIWLFFLVPLAGVGFAYWSYGVLWG